MSAEDEERVRAGLAALPWRPLCVLALILDPALPAELAQAGLTLYLKSAVTRPDGEAADVSRPRLRDLVAAELDRRLREGAG